MRLPLVLLASSALVLLLCSAEKAPPVLSKPDCKSSVLGCSSVMTGTGTFSYSYTFTFGDGSAGVIARLDADGKATVCGSPSTEAEVWEMWPRLEAASRLGLGEGFCSWYKARRAKP